jgi:hypothetical protein
MWLAGINSKTHRQAVVRRGKVQIVVELLDHVSVDVALNGEFTRVVRGSSERLKHGRIWRTDWVEERYS